MATFHLGRTTEDVRRELSDIFRTMKDPRVAGMLSIVKVDLSSDYSYCKVYVSSMDGLAAAKEAVKGLNNGAGYIRREINRRLRMRRSPEFHFVADDSIQHSAQIAQTLHRLAEEETGGEEPSHKGEE